MCVCVCVCATSLRSGKTFAPGWRGSITTLQLFVFTANKALRFSLHALILKVHSTTKETIMKDQSI